MNSENVGHPAERAASHEMAMGVIDLLQPVQIKKQHRKGSPGASVPLDFRVEDVEKPPVVGKPGERIGHGEMTDLFFGSFALRDVHNRAHDQKLVIGFARGEEENSIRCPGYPPRNRSGISTSTGCPVSSSRL